MFVACAMALKLRKDELIVNALLEVMATVPPTGLLPVVRRELPPTALISICPLLLPIVMAEALPLPVVISEMLPPP